MAGRLRIGLVAGEASGDLLGAALIEALRRQRPDIDFAGVAGPRMRAAGCQVLASSEELAVMGFVEPLRHLPRLMALRSRLRREFLSGGYDAFVGIDAPAFNLGLERRLREHGVPTVQYVSPQVWAWRPGRVRKIASSVDSVLCLLPFEVPFYEKHAVHAEFVGHPLADQVPLEPGREAARAALGIDAAATVVAILPGSRMSEVQRLGADFAAAARLLAGRRQAPPLFLAPMVNPRVAAVFDAQVRAAGAPVRLLEGRAGEVLAAADVALVASGTATLETLLWGCPMVVAYRVAAGTAFLARSLGLIKVPYISQPNLLAGEMLVPELLQEAVTPEALAAALAAALDDAPRRALLQRRFREIHLQLRQGGAARAAQRVLELIDRRRSAS
ncbi:MAG: lipid-A-disaccharide synthase [Steroidobacteraceae bacterium]